MKRVIVIDSGLSTVYAANHHIMYEGVYISPDMSIVKGCEGVDDIIGHGTAIIDLVRQKKPSLNQSFLIVRIFDEEYKTSEKRLVKAIQYVCENEKNAIVVIAAGIRFLRDEKILRDNVNRMISNGLIVISAFDNSEVVSFPAALQNVIGVNTITSHEIKEGYFYYNNYYMNIVMKARSYRVDKGKNRDIVKGNSFAAAEICSMLLESGITNYTEAQCFLRNNSYRTIDISKGASLEMRKEAQSFVSGMKKAIVFPFSKEIHAIAAYEYMLLPEIIGYYDVRESGKIGQKISNLLKYCQNDKTIDDIMSILWESSEFDSIICGHCDEINRILGIDYRNYILEMAIQHGKKVYFFDPVETVYSNCFFPRYKKAWLPEIVNGVLPVSNKPILMVCGTSSKQGKFTLQLEMRDKLQSKGINVFQISTEPTGYLFGMDYVYPIGYNSTVEVEGTESLIAVKDLLRCADLYESDIVITGSQSSTVPYCYDNAKYYTRTQSDYLMAVNPDAVVLCINEQDDMEYVIRTINFIESATEGKVISLAILDSNPKSKNKGIKQLYSIACNKSCYSIGDENDMNELVNNIFEAFS